MVEDFRPKIEFDESPLAQKVAPKETLNYATPGSVLRRRRLSPLFTWTAGTSASINFAIYCSILLSGNNSRNPLWFLFALANLPAFPLVLWLVGVCERAGIDPTAFDWLYAVLLGCVGAILWGLIAVVVVKFIKACFAIVVWLFGETR